MSCFLLPKICKGDNSLLHSRGGDSPRDITGVLGSQLRGSGCVCADCLHLPSRRLPLEATLSRSSHGCSGTQWSGGRGGAWQTNSCSEWLYLEVIFSARLSLTLKMEEARDIFHPKLNGKWQVSDFCKFLSLNSQTSADRDLKAPTWKSSKLNFCN